MRFYKWLKNEADVALQVAVDNNADKGLTERKNKLVNLYSVYLQEKLIRTIGWSAFWIVLAILGLGSILGDKL